MAIVNCEEGVTNGGYHEPEVSINGPNKIIKS
jgi:hypothetical protein